MPPFNTQLPLQTATYQPAMYSQVAQLAFVSLSEIQQNLTNFKDRITSATDAIELAAARLGEKLKGQIFSLESLFEVLGSIDELDAQFEALEKLLKDYEAYDAQYGAVTDAPGFDSQEIATMRSWIRKSRTNLAAIRSRLAQNYSNKHASRIELDVDHAIDWDKDPTVYQATTIAHGHMLCYRQRWKANGYSLGELLNTFALGPCQKKQIAVLEWGREEMSSRLEDTVSREALQASYSRDRDVNETINASLNEKTKGWSIGGSAGYGSGSSSSASGSGSYGPFKGALSGVVSSFASIGVSGAMSSQKSSRQIATNSMQKVRDRINQSSSAIRSQRSTVVQAVSQKESVSAVTEVIANKNLCHSVNYMFFEVMKHFVIEQELVDVKECLFIPLKIEPFDASKILRWSETLYNFVPGENLRKGFAAIANLESPVKTPSLRKADHIMRDIWGGLSLSFDMPLPDVNDPVGDNPVFTNLPGHWSIYKQYFGGIFVSNYYQTYFYQRALSARQNHWDNSVLPQLVPQFIKSLRVLADTPAGEIDLKLDITQRTRYRKGARVEVGLALSTDSPQLKRSDIRSIKIIADKQVADNARILVESGSLAYRMDDMNGNIFANSRIRNDIGNADTALIVAPMTQEELTDPAVEEVRNANALIKHLNDNQNYYHEAVFRSIDSNQLYMMLDGMKLRTAGGRSVASLVDNVVIDVVGNCIVMPVSEGERIDPVFRSVENLLDFYTSDIMPEPFRISYPTGGYFMEAVMGSCNSCEELDYTKARFNGFACEDEPTGIQEVSLDSRRADPGDLQAKDLPANIVNFQNNPALPEPTNLSGVFELLGKGDSFRDAAGLAATQANALAALNTASDKAGDMAKISGDLTKQAFAGIMDKTVDRDLARIQDQLDKGNLSEEDAKDLVKKTLGGKADFLKTDPPTETGKDKSSGSKSDASKTVDSTVKAIGQGAKKVTVKETNTDGSSTEVKMERDENAPFEPPAPDLDIARNDYAALSDKFSEVIDFSSSHHSNLRRSLKHDTVAAEYVAKFQANIVNGALSNPQKNLLNNPPSGMMNMPITNISGATIDANTATLADYFVHLHKVTMNMHGDRMFLPWHRQFLVEFEAALGMPVPYWDWYRNPQVPYALSSVNLDALDPAYYPILGRVRNSTDNVATALDGFWKNKLDRFEAGDAISWWTADGVGFSGEWERSFHDGVHVDINGAMGSTSTAPFDPIFWVHHCFVDKLWADVSSVVTDTEIAASTLYPGGLLSADIPGHYSETVSDVIEIAPLGYTYEGLFIHQ